MTLFSAECDWGTAIKALRSVCGIDTDKAYRLLKTAARLITVYDGRMFIQYHREADSFFVQIC